MNQKLVLMSGLLLVSLILVVSFVIDFEVGPTGDVVTIVGHPTGWVLPACVDSDATEDYPSGLNFFEKGNIATTKYGISWDTCTRDGALQEYYCRNNNRGIMNYVCQYGCANGACKTSGHRLNTPPAYSGLIS